MFRIEGNPLLNKFLLVRRRSTTGLKKMATRNRPREWRKPVRRSKNDEGQRRQPRRESSSVIATVPATDHAYGIFAIVVIGQQLDLFVGNQGNTRQKQRERFKQNYFGVFDQSNVVIIISGTLCYNITYLRRNADLTT